MTDNQWNVVIRGARIFDGTGAVPFVGDLAVRAIAIVGIEGSGNGNGSFGVDAIDGNPNCATNLWTENQFAITNPSGCIHWAQRALDVRRAARWRAALQFIRRPAHARLVGGLGR